MASWAQLLNGQLIPYEEPPAPVALGKGKTVQSEALSDEDIDALIAGAGFAADAKKWETEANLRVFSGYNNNVLRGPFVPEESALLGASFEVFSFRLPEEGRMDVYWYLLGEVTHYYHSENVEDESLVILHSRLSKPSKSKLQVGGTLQYIFGDQVFDISTTEVETDATQLQFQQFEVSPFLRVSLRSGSYVELEAGAKRNLFRDSKDDYTDPFGRVLWGKKGDRGGKVEISYEFGPKLYDERPQRDVNGFSVPDSLLTWWTHEIAGSWQRKWGADRAWKTKTKTSMKTVRDNGVGYNDYNRYSVRQNIYYEKGAWFVLGEAKVSYYDYQAQRVSAGLEDLLYRIDLRSRVRVARRLGEKMLFYVEGVHESSMSNRREDEFNQQAFFVGFDHTF